MIKRSTIERFEAKYIPEPNSGCWLWIGHTNHQNYGQFSTGDRKRAIAHRWSYEYFVGPIPNGLTVDHLCRVRSCVNPDHLEPVTQRENVLRGSGLTAMNARKTHCKHGHPFSGINMRITDRGYRICRICNRRNQLTYRLRRKKQISVATVRKEGKDE